MAEIPNGSPWWVKLFSNPATIANVVAFGAALLLLYQAAVEWPKQRERFHGDLQELRDASRDNQRLLIQAEEQQKRREELIREFRKVTAELADEVKRLREKKQ